MRHHLVDSHRSLKTCLLPALRHRLQRLLIVVLAWLAALG
ncbi:hypothetical protein XF_0745 [Xylella fastidiosa 9a5c]|uniref:Uncharacterized protein n=1 Tax=Xylella fastidiosa (strain 9a5c) TaxID=160492 RepID=Q9PFD3_XYLFA|nr:hypothetical protein XF_0745 [Xylella fastidiosa 9a5c]